MRIPKYESKHYAGSDMEGVASIVNAGYIFLPIFLCISLVGKLLEGDFRIAIVIGICFVSSFFVRHLFLSGHFKRSVMIVIIFFTILLTFVCSLGNGVNDVGIIGYPIIIGFSGILLDQRNLAIASLLSIVAVSWLVIGERLEVYDNPTTPIGALGDFTISSLMIALSGFVAFSLTSKMKQSLKNAQQEISISKTDAGKLSAEVNHKLEIIEEIHHTAINSLSHIQQLIRSKQDKSHQQYIPFYESLRRKVLVIEVAHGILLSEQTPIKLDIRELTARLLNEYEKNLQTAVLQFDVGNSSHTVPLDFAINFGICILELIHEADDQSNSRLAAQLSIDAESIILEISDFHQMGPIDKRVVIDLLLKQLNGTLERNHNMIRLTVPKLKSA